MNKKKPKTIIIVDDIDANLKAAEMWINDFVKKFPDEFVFKFFGKANDALKCLENEYIFGIITKLFFIDEGHRSSREEYKNISDEEFDDRYGNLASFYEFYCSYYNPDRGNWNEGNPKNEYIRKLKEYQKTNKFPYSFKLIAGWPLFAYGGVLMVKARHFGVKCCLTINVPNYGKDLNGSFLCIGGEYILSPLVAFGIMTPEEAENNGSEGSSVHVSGYNNHDISFCFWMEALDHIFRQDSSTEHFVSSNQ